MASNNDDDVDDVEYVEIVSGAASPGHAGELGELLLEMCSRMMTLTILLHEASPEEWKTFRKRIQAFKSLVNQLPNAPSNADNIGFKR